MGLRRLAAFASYVFFAGTLSACTLDRSGLVESECEVREDCGAGQGCVDGRCVADFDAGRDAGRPDASVDAGDDAGRDGGTDAGSDAGPPFDPRELGALRLWLRGDSLAPGPVSMWMDESGSGHHAIPTASASITAVEEAGARFVRFNGSGGLVTPPFVWGDGATVFVTTRVEDTTMNDGARVLHSDYMTHFLFGRRSNAEMVLFLRNTRTSWTGSVDGAWHVWTVEDDGATTTLFRDTTMGPTVGQSIPIVAVPLPLGIGGRAGEAVYLRGDIAEVLVYDQPLGASARERVIEYLQARWAPLLSP